MVLIDAVLRQRARMATPCKTLGELGQCGAHAFISRVCSTIMCWFQKPINPNPFNPEMS